MKREWSNNAWSQERITHWAEIWSALWRSMGTEWQWQNYDLYARHGGAGLGWQIFTVFNDAARLEGAIPLPEWGVCKDMIDHQLYNLTRADDRVPDYFDNLVDKFNKSYDV